MRRIRILLVDDDEEDFILTRDILASGPQGCIYELSWCNKYGEAINAMLKSFYDIYLVDYRLGKHSGLELLHEAIQSNCPDPMIILTGKGDPKIDEEALRIGAADYLTKDELNFETLSRAIRYALRHHKALDRIKSSENKFRILFERSKDPIMITDAEGFVHEANEAAVKFFDTTIEGLLNKNIGGFYENIEDRELFSSAMEQLGSVKDMEVKFISSSGQTKHCCISSFIQISQHGHKEYYYSILHDITNRRQREVVYAGRTEEDALPQLAHLLVNEIHNTLSNINFATEELKNAPDTLAGSELLDIIRKNCERINQVTTTLVSGVRKE